MCSKGFGSMSKKWFVSYAVSAQAFIKVTAQTAEEAEAIAERQLSTGLCHQCSGHIEIGDVLNEAPMIEEIER